MALISPYLFLLSPLFFIFICLLSAKILHFFVPALDSYTHAQNKWIDGLRGVAAVLVAMNHVPWIVEGDIFKNRPRLSSVLQQIISLDNFFGTFAVQIFFCITGMLFINKIMTSKNIDWMDFYKKRLLRLVPAYFAVCLLVCLIIVVTVCPISEPIVKLISEIPSVFSFNLLPFGKFNNFDFMQLIHIYWTLKFEWHFYFVLPIICLFLQKQPRIFIGSILVFAIIDLILNHFSCWVFFVSGGLAAPLMSKQFNQRQRRLSLCIIAVCLVLYAMYGQIWDYYGLNRWLLMSVFFAAITIARPAILSFRPISHLGLISYSFYLLHWPVLYSLFFIPGKFGINVHLYHIPYFVIVASSGLFLTTLLGCVFYLKIERLFMYPKAKAEVARVDNIFSPA